MNWWLTESKLPFVVRLVTQIVLAFLPVAPILSPSVLPALEPGS